MSLGSDSPVHPSRHSRKDRAVTSQEPGANAAAESPANTPSLNTPLIQEIHACLDSSDWAVTQDEHDIEACLKLFRVDEFRNASGEAGSTESALRSWQLPRSYETTSPIAGLRFIPDRLLGVGSYGVVLLALDQDLRRYVAIKVLRPSLGNPPQLVERFRREAIAGATLEHPGIVRALDVVTLDQETPCIVSEWVKGPTLARYLQEHGKLASHSAAWLVQRLAESVHFAHLHGYLHRDIKPSNVLLEATDAKGSQGMGWTPKLSDFGLAKRFRSDFGPLGGLSEGFHVVGTLRYMPPEQFTEKPGNETIAMDIYALGVILYEALSGRPVCTGTTYQSIIEQITESDPPRLRSLDPSIPSELQAVAQKCLAKDPRERYRSAEALAEDLGRFLKGEPLEAIDTPFWKRAWSSVRKHPIAVISTAFAFSVALIAGLLVLRSARSETLALQKSNRNLHFAADTLADTLFPIMEKIHHGLPVSNVDQYQWSKSLVEYYEVYARENPMSPLAARRLVTAYHEAANAASRVGDGTMTGTFRAKSIEQILQLGARDPTNAVWKFKLVMALIQFTHDSQFLGPPYETTEAREPLLQSAKMLIDQLVLEQPNNITYRDVQNAIRFRLCGMRAMLGREGDDYEPELVQLIESSESSWRDHPDQPLLAKYAVEANLLLARFHLKHGRREAACGCIEDALRVFASAYGPYASEEWAREIEYMTLQHGSSVFVSAGRFASALANLERLLALDDELRKSNRLNRSRMTAAIDFRAMKVQSLLGLQRLHEAKWAHRDWWRSIELALQSQEIDPSEYFELRCNDPFNKLPQLVMP